MKIGNIVNAGYIKELVCGGFIKFKCGMDDGLLIDNELPYIDDDSDIFIHSSEYLHFIHQDGKRIIQLWFEE